MTYLPDAPTEVPITCSHDVALVLAHPVTDAVIRIGALVGARDAFNAGVLERESQKGIFDSEVGYYYSCLLLSSWKG
jgi:hypothetical protein